MRSHRNYQIEQPTGLPADLFPGCQDLEEMFSDEEEEKKEKLTLSDVWNLKSFRSQASADKENTEDKVVDTIENQDSNGRKSIAVVTENCSLEDVDEESNETNGIFGSKNISNINRESVPSFLKLDIQGSEEDVKREIDLRTKILIEELD